jgi:hypothetical protein
MTGGFKILVHRNEDSAHFKLLGDFNDKAALELLDALRLHTGGASKIFIHTDSLDRIAGCNEQNLKTRLYNSSNGSSIKILSTGRYSSIFTSLEGRHH